MTDLNKNIQYLKGVGEKRASLFNKLGIFSVNALVHFYPRAYQDWSQTQYALSCNTNESVSIRATMVSPVKENLIRKGLTLYKCDFSDGETIIKVTIFNNKYLAKSLRQYEEYILFGKVEKNFTSAQMSSPLIEKAENGAIIHPIYPATEKLSSKAISKVVKTALDSAGIIDETLPDKIRKKYNLCTLDFAIRQIHFPDSQENIEIARKRLIFEELLTLQLGLSLLKSKKKKETSSVIKDDYTGEYESLLPFKMTNAQKKAITQCIGDMKKTTPMNRLLQGDVGSGKTAVGAGIVYSAVKNGFQCAFMAPTAILATQHYEGLSRLLEKAGVRVALLTGGTKAKDKKAIKSNLMDGKIDLIIGTHALIQNDVEFKNLGLVITDEQHRFGVEQRANLAMKGNNPHLLVMSATPIPRTLGLIIYGDLDISVLDELPPGRQPIRTDVVNGTYHKRIYNFIKKGCDEGHQAYIVCPLVDEGESELTPAKEYAEKLQSTVFKEYTVGLLHGKMKPKEKDTVMEKFSSGEIQILVSTTVIEVGVDVPNATIMLIENADRFGLSALHQLRGRVGRGKDKSFCILVTDNESENCKTRMSTMKQYSDGFKIADIDLQMRGPGDFFGKRQHGLPDLKIADMLGDIEVLKECQICAKEILKDDAKLDKVENQALASAISDMFRDNIIDN